MKHICSIYLSLLFSLITPFAWGQTPDSTARPVDNSKDRTVVSDRINEVDERERGPSAKRIMETADKAFGKRNFFAAMKYYSFILKDEPLQVEALKGYGESAFEIASLDSAEIAFQRLVDYGLSPAPEYFPKMRLAEVKFRKGNYSEARELFIELSELPQVPAVSESLKKEAASRVKDCTWALQNLYLDIIIPGSYKILDTTNVNTVDFAEYAAFADGDQLYFSAYRFDLKKDKANPKRQAIKLLTARGLDGNVGPGVPMQVEESAFNDLKRQHTAHFSYSESRNVVYYTLGDYVGDSATIRFDLYRSKKQPDGLWGPQEKLDVLNAPGFTTTEPSVGTLPGDAHETLFFVSDRPGGKGGRDLWYSQVIGDSLTSPLPLAAINTKGSEVTPFYHSPSNNLYFSTDGTDTLLRTIGGFDVYKAKYLGGGKWEKPKHMGTPINSHANDVFFVLDKESNKAYFSNNLRGNTNNSEEGCCYDIYTAEFIRPKLKAIGHHKLTSAILPFTRITLYEKGANGGLIPVANPQPDITSTYSYEVRLGMDYVLIAEKTDYTSDTLAFTTPKEVWSEEIVQKLYLMPHIYLVASVYDSDTREPLYGATTKFFDLGTQKSGKFVNSYSEGKSELLPENSYTKSYKLEFEHKYRVLASKEGYVAATSKADSSIIVSTIGLVESDTIRVNLFLHRPSALEEYLPITLYFDNDYPKRIRATDPQLAEPKDPFMAEMKRALLRNPKDPNYHDTILLDYQKTFVDYIRKKEEYKTGYTSVLSGKEKQNELDSIEYFFEKEVRMNWDSFFSLSDKIDLMLQNGDTIILTLKGYASPLSNPDYNFHLTNRRIASVYNHFMIFDGGIFNQYRELGGNSQLRFIREANGDGTAPPNMNKDPKNRRLSVYDYKVSRERRVQIIGAKVSKGSKRPERI